MYNYFINKEILGTFTGLVVTVNIIVQFTKFIVKDRFGDSFVRLYNFIISLILTFIFARVGEDLEGIALTVINAVLISLASMGAYETVTDPKAEKQKIR
ncbi:hypothetical protein [Clostridiisalibacter paucivorans]|uniref:hypothetical protein n=1 Tax=Clostridiisalibacter paucivorans TaxID=408753 RepID=UPI000478AFBE|nr:hypothetical protein [Clostridiisalibacter paucivorans]